MIQTPQTNPGKPASRATFLAVYVALLVLLGATVALSFFDLGTWGTALAMSIAATKALLIVMYFMHVRYSQKIVWLFALGAFLWLAILIGLTLNDYLSRPLLGVPGE